MDGLLELPVAFGTIYLGEQFCSYISLGNYSAEDVVNVTVKVLPARSLPRADARRRWHRPRT